MQKHRTVMIGVPTMDGKVAAQTMGCLVRDMMGSAHEIAYNLQINIGAWPISRARNTLVSHFLMSECDDLFFIDADLGWEPGAVPRIISHPVDVCAGIYPKRTDRYTDFPVDWGKVGKITSDPATGLYPAERVATGFLRIRRSVFERMVQAYPELEYEEQDNPRKDKRAHALFDYKLEGGIYWGEDYTFSNRWRALGGEIWVDPNIEFEHIGDKSFRGHLGNWLNAGQPGHPMSLEMQQTQSAAA